MTMSLGPLVLSLLPAIGSLNPPQAGANPPALPSAVLNQPNTQTPAAEDDATTIAGEQNDSNSVRGASKPTPKQVEALRRGLSLLLMVGFVLALVVLLGSYVLVRTMRRYRALTQRKPGVPTPNEDVWAMHQAPTDLDEEDNGPAGACES